MLLLEFTIEPFVEGHPGAHVTSALAAVETFGLAVDFGPFGTTVHVPTERAGDVAKAIFAAAFANGATHVSMHAARLQAVE